MGDDVLDDGASILSTPGREGSSDATHTDVEKKKSKRKNPFKKLKNSFRKSPKPLPPRPSSVSEMEHPGDSLRVLPGSPGSRRKLSDMKAQSLDYDRSYGASNHAERPRSFDMLRTETFGSSMDSASGDISPGFMSENQSDERRSRSDEPDSMDGRNGRGSTPTPQITITDATGVDDSKVEAISERQRPEKGVKYKLIIHLLNGVDLAIRDRSGESSSISRVLRRHYVR
jgi:hypothetical protein